MQGKVRSMASEKERSPDWKLNLSQGNVRRGGKRITPVLRKRGALGGVRIQTGKLVSRAP